MQLLRVRDAARGLVDVEGRLLMRVLPVAQDLRALPGRRDPGGQRVTGAQRTQPGCHRHVVLGGVPKRLDG